MVKGSVACYYVAQFHALYAFRQSAKLPLATGWRFVVVNIQRCETCKQFQDTKVYSFKAAINGQALQGRKNVALGIQARRGLCDRQMCIERFECSTQALANKSQPEKFRKTLVCPNLI